MKQVAQNYRSGELTVLDVPPPTLRPGGVLVRSLYSLISTGTEVMKVKEARLSLAGKARARPEQVRQVVDTVAQQGPMAAYKKVMTKLDSYTPLGYSLCGVVEQVGAGAEEFTVRAAGRMRGQRARAARRGQLGTHQSLRAGSRWSGSPTRRIRDGRGDCDAGGEAMRGPARRHRLCRSGSVSSVSSRCSSSSRPEYGSSASTWSRIAARWPRRQVRSGAPRPSPKGIEHVCAGFCPMRRAASALTTSSSSPAAPRTARSRRRRGSQGTGRPSSTSARPGSTCPGTPTTTKSSMSASRGRTVPAGTTTATSSKASTIPPATCVGPSGGTWPASSTFWPGASSMSSRWSPGTFPVEQAVEVYDRLSSGDLHGVGFLFEYPVRRRDVRRAVERPRRAHSEDDGESGRQNGPDGRFAVRGPGQRTNGRSRLHRCRELRVVDAPSPPCRTRQGSALRHVATNRSLSALDAKRRFGFAEASTDADAVLADDIGRRGLRRDAAPLSR